MIHPGHLPHGWLAGQTPLLAAVLLGILLAVLLPRMQAGLLLSEPSTPVSSARILAAVQPFVSDWRPMVDPLVSLDDGTQVKSSNVHGVEIDGVRYYYRLVHGLSADPVSRGVASEYQVVGVIEAGTQWETLIYTLTP